MIETRSLTWENTRSERSQPAIVASSTNRWLLVVSLNQDAAEELRGRSPNEPVMALETVGKPHGSRQSNPPITLSQGRCHVSGSGPGWAEAMFYVMHRPQSLESRSGSARVTSPSANTITLAAFAPEMIATEKLGCHGAAIRQLRLSVRKNPGLRQEHPRRLLAHQPSDCRPIPPS